jgi:hypothetical protein
LILVGGLIATALFTPAGAHVGGTPAHLWKKHLAPMAKKLFYTKAQSDGRYLKKTAASATFLSKYDYANQATLLPGQTVKGAWGLWDKAAAAGEESMGDISWDYALADPILLNIVSVFPSTDPNCSGTVANPSAAPGYLCVYQRATGNTSGLKYSTSGILYQFGAPVWIESSDAGEYWSDGSWAVTGS